MTKKNIKEEMFYDRLSIAYDICSALLFLHRNNVVYRDLVSKLYMINAIRGVHVLFSLQIITLLNTCSHHF